MANILIIYSTTDGQTRDICLKLQEIIEQQQHQVTIVPIQDESDLELTGFDKIVIGASVRYGKHSPKIVDFIEKNQLFLESTPNAFFSVNLVARKPEKRNPENNPYLQKFLKQLSWTPNKLVVFAGKVDYPSYGILDRSMIRLIMWMTKGPTDPKAVIEYTDWNQVEDFGRIIGKM